MNWRNWSMITRLVSSTDPRLTMLVSLFTRLWSYMKQRKEKKGMMIKKGKDSITVIKGSAVGRTELQQGPMELEGLQVTIPIQTLETDPDGVGQHDHGAKLDAGKPDLSLLLMFGRALAAVGQVGTYGAKKYTRGGWRGVSDGINRYTAALLRHLLKEDQSPVDDDLPVLHAAQVAWNALARLELIIKDAEDSHEAEERGG